ncbi:LppP/LprE family lipoprotein [Streptomyces sp. NPDC006670]|uniref:LppP/LprE family lipoprotein n=1 Tax=Streptomyces sp. NPDC006670 TaxID=3154476 RepID=UPI0033CDE649
MGRRDVGTGSIRRCHNQRLPPRPRLSHPGRRPRPRDRSGHRPRLAAGLPHPAGPEPSDRPHRLGRLPEATRGRLRLGLGPRKNPGARLQRGPDSAHGLQGPLRAIRASSTGGDGSVQGVFLFHGNQYVGRDTNPVGGAAAITDQDGRTVTVEYRKYRPGDPRCCPSGGTTTLRASWDGTRIVWTPPPNAPAT